MGESVCLKRAKHFYMPFSKGRKKGMETRRKRIRKKQIKPLAKATAQTNLYQDDERELCRMVQASGRKRADILRDLVAAGMRAKRLQAVGKDMARQDVVDAQKSVVSASQAPLITALMEQKDYIESSRRQMQKEYASIEVRLGRIENALGFLIKGFDRIIQNIVIIRALLWFYVFEFWYTMVLTGGNRLTKEQLKRNYEARIRDIKVEAARERSLLGELAFEKAVETVAANLKQDATNPPPPPSEN
jgi:hypothetical protein